MSRRSTFYAALSITLAMLVVSLPWAQPVSASTPGESFVATPAADLVDGQQVTVTGTTRNFGGSDTSVDVLQCLAGQGGMGPEGYFSGCSYIASMGYPDASLIQVSLTGRVSSTMTVDMSPFDGVPPIDVDCRLTPCDIAVFSYDRTAGGHPGYRIPIEFRPAGLTVTPDTGLGNLQTVEVAETDDLPPGAGAWVMQCAFLTRPGGGFTCGPVGTAFGPFERDFEGLLPVKRAFDGGHDAGLVVCDVNAKCLAVAVTVDSSFNLLGTAASVLNFE